MPFKSQAQRRKFYALKAKGKMSQKIIDEWEKNTPKNLPERVSKLAALNLALVNKADLTDHSGIAAIIRDKDNRILMQKHKKHGFWTIPVGKVDPGDGLLKTLSKELSEETGIKVLGKKHIAQKTITYTPVGKPVKVTSHLYDITDYAGKPKNLEPHKHSQQKFMSLDKIKSLSEISDMTKLFLTKSAALASPQVAPPTRLSQALSRKVGNTDPETSTVVGVGSAGAGAVGLSKATPLVTGRTTQYHGTTADYAKKIKEQGIHPKKAPGITHMLGQEIAGKDLVYTTPNKGAASSMADQAAILAKQIKNKMPGETVEGVAKRLGNMPLMDRFRLQRENRGRNAEVLKLSVPMWEDSIKNKVTENPELKGARNAKEFFQVVKQRQGNTDVPNWLLKYLASKEYKMLKDYTFKDSLGPEYIKGSPHYQRLSLSEMLRHAKARPLHAAGGVGLGLAGLGGLAYGAHKLYDGFKKSASEDTLSRAATLEKLSEFKKSLKPEIAWTLIKTGKVKHTKKKKQAENKKTLTPREIKSILSKLKFIAEESIRHAKS